MLNKNLCNELIRRVGEEIEYDDIPNYILMCAFKKITSGPSPLFSKDILNIITIKKEWLKNEKMYESILPYFEEVNTIEDTLDLYLDIYESVNKNESANSTLYQLAAELLKINNGETVCDFPAETGRFTFECAKKYGDCKFVLAERSPEYLHLLNGIKNIKNYLTMDVIEADALDYDLEKNFDKAFTFPPFGLSVKKTFMSYIPNNKKGLITSINSLEWLFVSLLISKMKKNGRIAAIMPERCLFSQGDSGYRRQLIENGMIEGIIRLPQFVIPGTSITLNIVIFSENNEEIKFMNASNMFEQKGTRVNNIINLNVDEIIANYDKPDEKTCKTVCVKELGSESVLVVDRFLFRNQEIKHPKKMADFSEILPGSQYTAKNYEKNFTNEDTGYQLLSSSNIENGFIMWSELQNVAFTEEKDLRTASKFFLKENDIILTSKSSKVKVAVATEELGSKKIVVTGGMLIIRPDLTKCNPQYVKMFFESYTGQELLKTIQMGTIVPNISASSLRDLVITLPDLSIQTEYGKKYENKTIEYLTMVKMVESLKNRINTFYEEVVEENL